jgi:outer membrane protein OmpA-like peptidoglycan-associated protein/Tol biopolymer transport system component
MGNYFEEAIPYYEAFVASDLSTKIEKSEAKQKIKECELGKRLLKDEINCFVDNLGIAINSQYDDYQSVTTNNDADLFFTSRRLREKEKVVYAIDGKQKESTYRASRKGENDYSLAEKWGKNIESLQTISKDGQYAIVYSSNGNGDLYEMKIVKNQWSKPKAIKTVNTSAHETSASLSPNGDTLYFCSDRKTTFGGHDIYMSTKNKNGKWSKPQNLGDVVNTPSDEISVCIDQQGKYLYFSSRGHQGIGGFDIFKTSFENGAWTQPENIGYPVSSPFDDVYFSISEDGKFAYMASNRGGGQGGQDIYKVTFLGEHKLFVYKPQNKYLADNSAVLTRFEVHTMELEKEKTTTVQGIVIDAKTKTPLFASIELTDIEQNKLLAVFTSDSTDGKYILSLPSGANYGVSVKKEGYLFYSENFNVAEETESQTINQIIALNKIEVNQIIILKNIFFDVNKTTLKPESAMEIENAYKLLAENPTIEIEISGHTDNTGGAATNRKLSEGRAAAVVNALKDKGIDPSRMKSVGYGPDRPIASNKTEAGRSQNRRTEFKVIKK